RFAADVVGGRDEQRVGALRGGVLVAHARAGGVAGPVGQDDREVLRPRTGVAGIDRDGGAELQGEVAADVTAAGGQVVLPEGGGAVPGQSQRLQALEGGAERVVRRRQVVGDGSAQRVGGQVARAG